MDDLVHVKQLVLQLIASEPFEYCARLKQRLNRQLISAGSAPFDERKFGYRKFSDFLSGQFDDRIHLEKPVGPGDIHVTLKQSAARTASPHSPALSHEQPLVIRSDVWQAFTNPDAKRKRYLNRVTRRVMHFVDGTVGEYQQKLQAAPHDYAEIEFIEPVTQQEWMSEFLNLLDLPEGERAPLESIIATGYSSSVNAAFTKALGARQKEWRKLRTLRITERIQTWATQHSVPLEDLSLPKQVDEPPVPTPEVPALLTLRQQAFRLLELMSDDDIAKIAIPVLLSSVLSKSQI
ncbi:OST-HTH/LOTUS domain-containing protein [Pseudomonas aeruginosa]|uniref:OST-HTH/LOTUS domain-containing protein n=1 Tax=Pseudomonas aeruginosa group TaxID=136841 RepID=UPI00071BECA1|nr:hypothetical protein [Pseudomonas paraeruginosa]KSP90996.1 hypothetical protein APB27_12565 [Pseudomonas aeruginosa]MBG5165530.1 hypothetical protein [Pseudomonas aeruginosa]RTT26689.1 hypothetical protein DY956_30215 [Pseudomonas paraeruginosa]